VPVSAYDLAAQYRDAEQAYCCAILHTGSREVIDAVPTVALADPVARGIHKTARQLIAAGIAIDLVTVTTALVSGPTPGNWQADVPAIYCHPGAIPRNWHSYVALVREGDYRRRAVAAAERVVQAAETSSLETLSGLLAEAGQVTR
jgi:replicative DNA helicase